MFHYGLINTALIDSLAGKLESDIRGFSLIGPRFSGKRFVLERIAERLQGAERDVSLISVDESIREEQRPWSTCLEQLGRGGPKRRPSLLLVGDIDNLRPGRWVEFVSTVVPFVESRRLQVVLTGGAVLAEWLPAVKQLSDTDGYVLQGFDLPEFQEVGAVWAQRESIAFENRERQLHLLWQLTSGSSALLAWFYYLVIERRMAGPADCEPLGDEIIRELLGRLVRRGVRWTPAFPRATYEIRREPGVWDALELLLHAGRVTGVDPLGAPTALELAGVAKRKGSEIHFASSVMKDFAISYYDSRRLGDFWASQGDWVKAFARFSIERMPDYYFDRTEAKQTVASLCELLQGDAGSGIQKVHDRFVDICRDYFRCPVGCLTWDGELWELTANHSGSDYAFDSSVWLGRLPRGTHLTPGKVLPLVDGSTEDMCVVLGDPRPGWLNAFLVIPDKEARNGSRKRLFERVLASFARAYETAIEREAARTRHQDAEVQKEVLAELFRRIGGGSDVKELCEVAARQLRECGYRRVLISLVDRARTRIQGIFDASPDNTINIADETNYRLDNPRADIQPYVVVANASLIVPNAFKDPLVNLNVARRAGMKAFAIVPIPSLFNPSEAIGTIHVEREDRGHPTEAEMTDLRAFAVGFSGALSLAELNSYWAKLADVFEDPIFFTRADTKTMLNEAAVRLQQQSSGAIPAEVAMGLERAREQRNLHFTNGLGESAQAPALILSDKLTDNLGNTLGWFAYVKLFDRTNRFLQMYTHFAAAENFEEAIRILFAEFERQGFESGRLYLLPRDSPESLVLVDCFYKDPEKRARVLGARESMSWPKRSEPEPNLPWRAINSKEPVVFQFCPDEPYGVTWSPEGFPVVKDRNPLFHEILGRTPYSYCIELPLLGADGPIGKVVLQGNLPRAQDFELYRLLIASSTEILTAFLAKDYRSRLVSREQAEQLMSETLHNINGRLGLFRSAVNEYKSLAAKGPEMQEVTQRVERALEGVARMTRAAARGVSRIMLTPHPFSLMNLLKSFNEVRKDCVIELVITEPGAVEIEGDLSHIEAMFNELLNNSVEACMAKRNRACPEIRIGLQQVVHPRNEQPWLEINYSDNGPGIEDDIKPLVFDPWKTFHNKPSAGRGLGLSYVRRVVEAHRGSIRVADRTGGEGGALFVIRLPLKQARTGIDYRIYDSL